MTIPGAVSATYDPPVLTETTCYRRRVNSCSISAVSNVVTITVNPTPTPTATVNTPVICSNVTTDIDLTSDVPGTISLIVLRLLQESVVMDPVLGVQLIRHW